MAIPHQLPRGALGELIAAGGGEGLREALGRLQAHRGEGGRADLVQRLVVLPQRVEHGSDVAALGRHRVGLPVEAGQPLGDRVDVGPPELAALGEAGQAPLLVHPAHLDRVLDRSLGVLGGELEAAVAPGDRPHPPVDLRRQALVEPHLLPAEVPPPLQRPVVEEGEGDRSLDLVGEIAGEQHPGDMGIAQLDPLRALRVEAGVEHRGDHLRKLALRRGGVRIVEALRAHGRPPAAKWSAPQIRRDH